VKIQINHLKFIAFLLVSLTVSTLYFLEIPFIKKLSLGIEDSKFIVRRLLNASPEPDKRVVVAAVDEKSINKLGRWPWSRQQMAGLIGKLGRADAVALADNRITSNRSLDLLTI